MHSLFSRYKTLILSAIFLLLYSVTVSFAAPLYTTSSTTLDPQCAPSNPDCRVSQAFTSLGIGTTTPTASLDVVGNMNLEGVTTSAIKVQAFGDSITVGVGASNQATTGYIPLLETAIDSVIVNNGVSATMAADQAPLIFGTTIGTQSISTYMIGTNDQNTYATNADKLAIFKAAHQSEIAWLAIPASQKVTGRGGSVQYTGTWADTPVYGIGKTANNANGSTATFTVTGQNVLISMIQGAGFTGTYNITIDGVDKGDFSTTAAAAVNTAQGIPYGPRLLVFKNLTNTEHTVVITITNTGNSYFDWAAGVTDGVDLGPEVYVANIPYQSSARYTASGTSTANTDAFNAAIASNVSELAAMGLGIQLVDVNSVVNVSTHLGDGLHPNDAGYVVIKNAFDAVMPTVTHAPDTSNVLSVRTNSNADLFVLSKNTSAGNAASAGIQFQNDTNSFASIFRTSSTYIGQTPNTLYLKNTSGDIAYIVGSTEKMRLVGVTGNVGIGTAAPGGTLTLAGTRAASAWGVNGVNLRVSAATYTDTSTPSSTLVNYNMTNSFAVPTLAANNTAVTYNHAATVYIAGAPIAGANVAAINGAYSLWVESGISRFTGDAMFDGKMIAVTIANPGTSKLHLPNTFDAIVFRAAGSANVGASIGAAGGSSNASDLIFSTSNSVTAVQSERMRIMGSTGLVGIGTSTPGAVLHITAASPGTSWGVNGGLLRVQSSFLHDSGSPGGTVAFNAVSAFGATSLAAGTATTYTNAATLYVAGAPNPSTNVTITNPYALYVASGLSQFGTSAVITGTTMAVFQNAGGTCSVVPSTSGGITCSSDYNLKKNITTLSNTPWVYQTSTTDTESLSILNKVLLLQPVQYNWNVESDTDTKHAGFIAQDVQQLFPELVTTDPTTNLLSLNYTGLLPYTIQALQDINIKVAAIPELSDKTLYTAIATFLDGIANRGEAVVSSVKADKIESKQICIDDLCFTKDQLQLMLQNSNITTQVQPTVPVTTIETPVEEVVPVEQPAVEIPQQEEVSVIAPTEETVAQE